MRSEDYVVRFLEICGGTFMFLVALISVCVFVPAFIVKKIFDGIMSAVIYFQSAQNRRYALEGSALFIIIIVALMFLSIISQP